MKLLYCDTETTGTEVGKHGVVQFAGIIEVPDAPEYFFSYNLQPFPTDVIEDAALAVTGLTREQIQQFHPPLEVMKQVEKIFGRYVKKFDRSDKFIMVGYNARFDYDHLRKLWEKCGNVYFGSWVHFPAIDVMNLAAAALMEKRHTLKDFKLATVAGHFGLTVDGTLHDALADIRLTRDLFKTLMRRHNDGTDQTSNEGPSERSHGSDRDLGERKDNDRPQDRPTPGEEDRGH